MMDCNELILQKLLELAPADGLYPGPAAGTKIANRHKCSAFARCLYPAQLIYMAQGEKVTEKQGRQYRYGPGDLIVYALQVPSLSAITKASGSAPMVCLSLSLERDLLVPLLNELPFTESAPAGRGSADEEEGGIAVQPADAGLQQALLRLLNCTSERPELRDFLLRQIKQEIYARLLLTPAGRLIWRAHRAGTRFNQIQRALTMIKDNFAAALNFDEVAAAVCMSPSSFYRNFGRITDITPLQYQKQLRLYEAQRLLVSERLTAEQAAYQVGYRSPAQFSRDFKRMFGTAPRTLVKQLFEREETAHGVKSEA